MPAPAGRTPAGTGRCAAGAWGAERRSRQSCSEILFVLLLDGFDLAFQRRRVRVQQLDLRQWRAAGLFLDLAMERAQSADIAVGLLGFPAEHELIEQPRCARVRSVLQDRGI